MDIQLKLADFVFSNFEIPEGITFGGHQMLAIHKMVGGARIIDSMGRDDDPMEWTGTFTGKNALARARYLHALRIEGKSHVLTWDSISYTVVVKSFHADYKRPYLIPYKISCEVLRDNTNPSTGTPPVDITRAIKEDIEAAVGAGKEIYQYTIEMDDAPLMKVSSLIKDIKNFVNATNAQIRAVRDAISEAQNAVTSEIASITNQLQALTTLGGVLPGNSVSVAALNLGSTANMTITAYKLENIKYTLERTDKNLTAVTSTPNANTIQVSGTTLYRVAMEQYGDATKWDVIAAANGLTDPTITGVQTLIIPPVQSIPV